MMVMKTSNGMLIFFSTVVLYWGLFFAYIAEVRTSTSEGIIGVMFGLLIPILVLKYVNDKCEWDWS